MKDILPAAISSNQTAYVKNRYMSEGGRLIYDVPETANIVNKEGFLVTVDIKRTSDSVDHFFFISWFAEVWF